MPNETQPLDPEPEHQEPPPEPPREEQPPPGFTLRHTLRGHTRRINRIAWSPDGRMLASPSFDKTIRIWDMQTGKLRQVLRGHSDMVYSVAWSPDGRTLASGSGDETIRLWDTGSGQLRRILGEDAKDHYIVAWSPNGRTLASGGDAETIKLWDAASERLWQTVEVPSSDVCDLTWSPDSSMLAIGGGAGDIAIAIWDARSAQLHELPASDASAILTIAWSPDGRMFVTGGEGRTIQLWDAQTQHVQKVLEGHTDSIGCVAFSRDGQLLASKSNDDTVRLWRCDTWEPIAALTEYAPHIFQAGLAFHPSDPTVLATLGENDTVIRIWNLDVETILANAPKTRSIHYTTAKIALVGDSGVGKTGLGWRLSHGEFKEHSSTHGQQFWVIDELGATRADGTECEAILWDLAGQPDYRLVHALFLDDVDQALVLFDPANRQEPLKGVEYWLKQLAHRKDKPRPCGTILVGARADRGTPTLAQEEIEAFCRRYNIGGGYIGTSALSGAGLPELIERLKALIDWDAMPATITTTTFKRIKDYVLALKADPQRKGVLVSPVELRARLAATDTDWSFDDAEMITAVGTWRTTAT